MKTWETSQKILVILAHPDDPEFFCGGTIAKWVGEGNLVSYLLLTRGEKGVNDHFNPDDINEIIQIRKKEQENAAKVVGVNEINYLHEPDGYLTANILIRRKVVKSIREMKPDIILTCDPTNYYLRDTYINHPDHRAAGQIVIDSVFPAVQNPVFFPDLIINNNLSPHQLKEVWLSLPLSGNTIVDVTGLWTKKLKALHTHESQIGNPEEFDSRMMERRVPGSSIKKPRFEEIFHRIILRR
jgi:LmbE family N-acetylglucosaminyl deacetylase